MSWSVALGVLSFALPGAPAQVPPVPALPPVTVTTTSVPLTTDVTVAPVAPIPTALTVPATDSLLEDPSTLPATGSDPRTSLPPPTPSSDAASGGATPSPTPAAEPPTPAAGSGTAVPQADPAADPRDRQTRPLLRQPATRLLAAAGDTAGEFAPTGAVAALIGLFLLANGAIRRRDDLAHVQLDDRDAIVRFD